MKNKYLAGIILLVVLLCTYITINYFDLKSVYNSETNIKEKIEDMKFIVGGDIVGIKLLATGVLVVGIDDVSLNNLKVGDVILKVNDISINTGKKLEELASNSKGISLNLEINRNGNIIYEKVNPSYDNVSEKYKLGIWVKDSSAGVGTITFYETKSKMFAGLGHGVTETKEEKILPINSGAITTTHIYSIKKGEAQNPGEIKGTITSNSVGEIYGNTDKGIYGKYFKDNIELESEIQILPKIDIKEGKASILVTLEDNIKKEYEINIEKILLTSKTNKSMIIKIVDEELLEKTGGIIQGMSGCPIIQNGKLVGAVTHVLLSDPTRGYGVFIEDMIEDMLNI